MTRKKSDLIAVESFGRSFAIDVRKLKTREEWYGFYTVAAANIKRALPALEAKHPKQLKRLKMLAFSFETLSMSVQPASEIEPTG